MVIHFLLLHKLYKSYSRNHQQNYLLHNYKIFHHHEHMHVCHQSISYKIFCVRENEREREREREKKRKQGRRERNEQKERMELRFEFSFLKNNNKKKKKVIYKWKTYLICLSFVNWILSSINSLPLGPSIHCWTGFQSLPNFSKHSWANALFPIRFRSLLAHSMKGDKISR